MYWRSAALVWLPTLPSSPPILPPSLLPAIAPIGPPSAKPAPAPRMLPSDILLTYDYIVKDASCGTVDCKFVFVFC